MQLKVKIHYLSIIYFNSMNSCTYTYAEAQTMIEQMFVRVNTIDLYNTDHAFITKCQNLEVHRRHLGTPGPVSFAGV